MNTATRILIFDGPALMFLSLAGSGDGCLGALGVGLEGDREAAEFGGGIAGAAHSFSSEAYS